MFSLTKISQALFLSFLLAIPSGTRAQSLASTITFKSESLNNVNVQIRAWHLDVMDEDYILPDLIEFKLTNSYYKTSIDLEMLAFVRVTIKGFKDTRPIFFIQPGDNVVFEAELINGSIQYSVNGNELNAGLSNWNQHIKPYYENRMNSKYYQQRLAFIKAFPNSKFSSFLLVGDKNGLSRYPADTLIKYAEHLTENALGGYYGNLIEERIGNLAKIKIGMNLYGTKTDSILKISSHKGKLIVIDFWATWCRSCVKELPDMKKSYQKNNRTVHYISISADHDKRKWEKFVQSKKMIWEQVYDDIDAAREMGVDIFPTKFVINREGVVTNIYIGDYPDFFTELDALILQEEDE